MKRVAYCIVGLLLGSLLAWAILFGWAAANLNPGDSLWDRNPQAANWFFVCWALFAMGGGTLGAWLARRRL